MDKVVGTIVGSASTMEAKYIDRPRDCENTVLKMAQKRAHVGAALGAFGMSDQFTQDMEDADGAGADADGVSTAKADVQADAAAGKAAVAGQALTRDSV